MRIVTKALAISALLAIVILGGCNSQQPGEVENEMLNRLFGEQDEVAFEFAGTSGMLTAEEKQQVLDAVGASSKPFTDDDHSEQLQLAYPGGTYIDMTYTLQGKSMSLFYNAVVPGYEYFAVTELDDEGLASNRLAVWASAEHIQPMEELSMTLWNRGDAQRQLPLLHDALFHGDEPVEYLRGEEYLPLPAEQRALVYTAALSSVDNTLTNQQSQQRAAAAKNEAGLLLQMRYTLAEQVYILEYDARTPGYESFSAYEYFQEDDMGYIVEVLCDTEYVPQLNEQLGQLLP